jgi:hypothetical protein
MSGCTAATLEGDFGLQWSNRAVTIDPMPGTAGLLRLRLDGAGNVSGYSSVKARGAWQQSAVAGNYSVNDDCTASFALRDADGNAQNFTGVVVVPGSEALVLLTDAGTGGSGTLRRLSGLCQVGDAGCSATPTRVAKTDWSVVASGQDQLRRANVSL